MAVRKMGLERRRYNWTDIYIQSSCLPQHGYLRLNNNIIFDILSHYPLRHNPSDGQAAWNSKSALGHSRP